MDLSMLQDSEKREMAEKVAAGLVNAIARTVITDAFYASPTQSSLFDAQLSPANNLISPKNSTIAVLGDLPFYASSSVLIYVASMCTAISWFLVIILLITPGQFLGLSMGRNQTWLPGRDMPTSVSARPGALISGSRPWLQKAAALLVAITMTLSSADTLSLVEDEYRQGHIDSSKILIQTSYRIDIRIFRVISNIFLLLAQVQTLIRLFPRQKEKLIIKWFGFLLILLDLIFSSLDSFWILRANDSEQSARPLPPTFATKQTPVGYVDAISALSYLFELALSLLYAAWVFYYIGTKRRYAFVSSKMPNISLIAVLAIISVIIPICFFVVDITVQNAYGWGDFLRSVGGVAASVVVWEWVERMEALEQDEKKDGILGREIFDEDETLGRAAVNPPGSSDSSRSGSRDDKGGSATDTRWQSLSLSHLLQRFRPAGDCEENHTESNLEKQQQSVFRKQRWPKASKLQHPPHGDPSIVPISRADTTSAVSTEYAVHYHPVAITPPIKGSVLATSHEASDESSTSRRSLHDGRRNNAVLQESHSVNKHPRVLQFDVPRAKPRMRPSWTAVPNPFKRRKESPPLEIKQAMSLNSGHKDSDGAATVIPASFQSNDDAARHNQRWSHVPVKRKRRNNPFSSAPEPTIIPAPPRGHVWAPDLSSHSPAVPKAERLDSMRSNQSRNLINGDDTTGLELPSSPQRTSSFTLWKGNNRPPSQAIAHNYTPNIVLSQTHLGKPQSLEDQNNPSG